VQTIGRQPYSIRAPDSAPVHYERHRPEQTVLYRLVQQHAATFFEQASGRSRRRPAAVRQGRVRRLPRMRHPGPRLSALALPRRVRVCQVRLPIPLRLLLAAQPKLVTPVLQAVHRVVTRHLLRQAVLKAEEADSGAVTLIQPSLPMTGSAANLNIHLHCLVLDGVYRCDTEGEPVFG